MAAEARWWQCHTISFSRERAMRASLTQCFGFQAKHKRQCIAKRCVKIGKFCVARSKMLMFVVSAETKTRCVCVVSLVVQKTDFVILSSLRDWLRDVNYVFLMWRIFQLVPARKTKEKVFRTTQRFKHSSSSSFQSERSLSKSSCCELQQTRKLHHVANHFIKSRGKGIVCSLTRHETICRVSERKGLR